jgi:hypothetical protein
MIDLQKAIAFWEMRDEIMQDYSNMVNICSSFNLIGNEQHCSAMLNKIEALDKKEKES